MLIARDKLNKLLEDVITTYITDSTIEGKVIIYCFDKYAMPFFRTQTILRLDASTVELKDIEIYWILSAIAECAPTFNIKLDTIFTDIEIANYSKSKYIEESVKFPLVLHMIKVSDKQWIGSIDVKTLVKWRNTIIKYNKALQRRLKIVSRNGLTFDVITLNKKSVREIIDLVKEKKFIPNPITLNIGEDEIDYYYDEDSSSLVINSIDHFDLTDGYHRMVAISKVIEEDPFFEFEMELRITNFSEAQASQFIWQEEQRTEIPKKDIRSYNYNDISNRIVNRINESPSCNLCGCIVRGGLIDFATFADMVYYLFIRNLKEDQIKLALINVSKDIIDSINIITATHTELLIEKTSITKVKILVFCCYKYYMKEKKDICKMYDYLLTRQLTTKDKQILNNGTKKRTVNLLEDILKGWEEHV